MNHLARDLEELTEATFKLAAFVEEMIRGAAHALGETRNELAKRVVAADAEIDRIEVEIEERCLRFLALHDPVAADLRRVMTVLKVNHELERMADLAVGIARRAMALAQVRPAVPIPEGMEKMAGLVAEMVRGSLDALVEADPDRARAIIAADDEVDRLHLEAIDDLKRMLRAGKDRIDSALQYLAAAANLERIADHATNIAEEVVHLREGTIIRHRTSTPAPAVRRGATSRNVGRTPGAPRSETIFAGI